MLLVRELIGPTQCRAGSDAVYKVVAFNEANPSQSDRASISWTVESDGVEVAKFLRVGDTLQYTVPRDFAGRAIRVMAYRNAPSAGVSVTTRIDNASIDGPIPVALEATKRV